MKLEICIFALQLISAVNILFSYGKYTKLIKTSFLELVNYSITSQLIVTTINSYNIPYDVLTFLINNSSFYMLKAFRDYLSPLIPNLLHFRVYMASSVWSEYRMKLFILQKYF